MNALLIISVMMTVMFGEAHVLHDDLSAKVVGHIYLNRLKYVMHRHGHDSYVDGQLPELVASAAFYSYGVWKGSDKIPEKYRALAQDVLDERRTLGIDLSNGCLYVLSWHDLRDLAGVYAPYHRSVAHWKSPRRIIRGGIFQLYAYRDWYFDNPKPIIDALDARWMPVMKHYDRLLKAANIVPEEVWQ